tara:strand:+ start:145 stop:336 length:192 start_codon:yes stop_codon:yes gene_type:complete
MKNSEFLRIWKAFNLLPDNWFLTYRSCEVIELTRNSIWEIELVDGQSHKVEELQSQYLGVACD